MRHSYNSSPVRLIILSSSDACLQSFAFLRNLAHLHLRHVRGFSDDRWVSECLSAVQFPIEALTITQATQNDDTSMEDFPWADFRVSLRLPHFEGLQKLQFRVCDLVKNTAIILKEMQDTPLSNVIVISSRYRLLVMQILLTLMSDRRTSQ